MTAEEATNRRSVRSRIGSVFTWPLLIPLVVVDLVFVAISVVFENRHGIDYLHTSPWLLEADGGYSEIWGYAIETSSGRLPAGPGRTCPPAGLVSARAALFLAAFADDEMRLHENKGAWLAEMLAKHLWFPADGFLGLRADDLGEMLVWGLLAVVPLAIVIFFYRRSDSGTRRDVVSMAVLVASLRLLRRRRGPVARALPRRPSGERRGVDRGRRGARRAQPDPVLRGDAPPHAAPSPAVVGHGGDPRHGTGPGQRLSSVAGATRAQPLGVAPRLRVELARVAPDRLPQRVLDVPAPLLGGRDDGEQPLPQLLGAGRRPARPPRASTARPGPPAAPARRPRRRPAATGTPPRSASAAASPPA